MTASTHFRRLSLWLISLLMGLLALGPFLHAHFGASQATGFHVNGLQTAVMTQAPGTAPDSLIRSVPSDSAMLSAPSDTPVLSLPTEQESPAVGVVTSLPRWEDSFSPDTAHVMLLSVVVLGVLPRWMLAAYSPPVSPPLTLRIFKAGFPPPAHAPPTPL